MKISSRFKSIQSSIFCAVSILVLSAVLVVTVVSLRYTNSSIYENSVMYTQTIIKQLNQNIDSYISYMDNIASVIAQSGDAYKYLYSENGYGATKNENYSEYRQRLVEQFKTILKGRADIRNIGIVREDKNTPSLFDNGLSVRNTYVDLNTQPWYADAVGKYDRYNLTSSHVQNVIKGERPWVITLSRGIRNYTGTEAEDGVVFLDLNYSAISELCAQSSMGDKGYVFILDQNGNIVYHPQQQQLYNELQTENISLVMNAKSDIVTVGKGDDEKIYALSHSDITGWTIVGCMNMSELLRNSRQTRSIYVLVAVGLIIVALLISSLIARNITLPIQKLRDSMKSVQKGNFDIEDIEVISDNEIGSLTRSFNVMTHRIQDLMEQNVKEQEAKRKSELKALQSQINPHFLYNVLDTINWMARKKGEDNICRMVTSISSLMRASISNKRSMVYIREEIKYVQDYLYIQETRYGDKFTSYIEVDERLNELEIPKMTIQTLVENAVVHGVENATWDCFLYVSGEITDGMAVFTVKDDGVGMSQEQLEKLMGTEEEPDHEAERTHTHLGVYAVRKRLDYVYQNKARMSITSEPGKGTQVILEIPMNGNVGVTYRKCDEPVNENNKKRGDER